MSAELAHIENRARRGRFALGCARVALFPPHSGARSTRAVLAILTSGVAVLVLALYGQHRIASFPATGGHGVVYTAFATAFGIVLLGAYVLIALRLARISTPRGVASRRHGIRAGVLVGIVVLAASTPLATTVFGTQHAAVASTAVSWFTMIVVTLAATRVAARVSRDRRAGRDAGMWAGMTAGFVLAVGLLAITLGAPAWISHDPAAISDYRDSLTPAHYAGYHTHYATITGYATSENSDTALILGLVWLPALSLALGHIGGTLAARAEKAEIPAV